MGLSLVTAPTIEPVSLEEARQDRRLDASDEDAMLAGYLIAARVRAEGYTGRKFITQTWDYTLDAFPNCIELPIGPLQSVTSIQYLAPDGTLTTLASTEYTVDTKSVVPRITPAFNKVWPITRWIMNAVIIRVVVGYGDLSSDTPEPIRLGIIRLAGSLFEQREDTDDVRRISTVPLDSSALLYPYRVFY